MLNNQKAYQVFLVHILVLISLYTLLHLLGIINVYPNSDNLIQWDAGWYKSIIENGYQFKKDEQSNTGFFPLFPFTWKFLRVSSVWISVLNYLLFLISVSIIKKIIPRVDTKLMLLSLSIPSLFFMFTPYSEAFFFISATLFLYANQRSSFYLKIVALAIASLARPTIFFFLPAIIFSELLSPNNPLRKLVSIFSLSLVIILSTLISFYIIGFNDNHLFAYSDSQIGNWDHSFSFPQLPFTTWRGYRIIWLDFFALLIIVCSVISSLYYFLQFITKKLDEKIDKNLLLSLGYLSMILIYVTFFHPKEASTGLTSILSLNRYVFCTPFLFYLMYYYFTNKEIKINRILGIGLIFCLLLIGFPFKNIEGISYLYSLIFVLLLILYLAIQFIPRYKNKKVFFYSTYLINCCLQVYLFQSFLKGNWIG